MNNRLFFDLASWGYDMLTRQDIWREQIREVLRYPAQSPTRILDVGCGPGVSAFELAAACPAAEVVGIDLSPRMVARAQCHHATRFSGLRNVRFEVGDATELGFEDGSFDFAVGHSFLYLVPDRAAVLREVRRLLGPDATLVLMEPNLRGSLRSAARAGFDRNLRSASLTDSARFATSMVLWRAVSGNVGRLAAGDVEGWMLDAGFDQVEALPTLGGLGMHCVGRVGASSGVVTSVVS